MPRIARVAEQVLVRKLKAPPPASSAALTIHVSNSFAWLRTTNHKLIESVSQKFTFENKAKQAMWDTAPVVASFVTKKGRFGTGLLPLVKQHLESENLQYTIKDDRTPIQELHSGDPSTAGSKFKQISEKGDLFADVGVTLRDYQVLAVNEVLKQHRGVVKCATGGGKSWILAAIIKALGPSVPVVIMVRQKILIEQLFDTLKKAGLKNVGKVTGTTYEPNTITICTIQSAEKMNDRLDRAKVLMVDEVHDFTSALSQYILNGCINAYMRIGFSATPFKISDVHKHSIISCFGPLITDIGTSDLIEKQVLATSVVHAYPIKFPNISHVSNWAIAEKLGVVENKYFHGVVAALVNSIPKGRIMILVKRISHGDSLHALLPGSFWISGRDDIESRSKVMELLRTSAEEKVVALVSSVGFVGVDVYVHHVVNAAGGKEPYLTIQKIGRGLRRAEDKDKLDYHDFNFSYSMNRILASHSTARMKTLEGQGHKVIREREIKGVYNPYAPEQPSSDSTSSPSSPSSLAPSSSPSSREPTKSPYSPRSSTSTSTSPPSSPPAKRRVQILKH